MQKKTILCLALALCAILLTACQQKETFPNQPQTAVTEAPTVESEAQVLFQNATVTSQDYDDGTYDPSSEEGGDEEDLTGYDDGMLSAATPERFMAKRRLSVTVAPDPNPTSSITA